MLGPGAREAFKGLHLQENSDRLVMRGYLFSGFNTAETWRLVAKGPKYAEV